jgi:hypothetical protein
VATYADGTVYEGGFVEGQREGEGTITRPDGFTYTGGWRDGELHGMGTATYRNGDVYEGMFAMGQRQGEGTMRYAADGEVVTGTWENGMLTSGAEPADTATESN